jgi:hypothetical protein
MTSPRSFSVNRVEGDEVLLTSDRRLMLIESGLEPIDVLAVLTFVECQIIQSSALSNIIVV